mgnify:CR=1 FL=1
MALTVLPEKDFDEYGALTIYAKYEVKATEIDTIHIEGIPAPLYGQTSKDYLDDVIAKVKVNNELYDSKNQAFPAKLRIFRPALAF